MFKLQTGFCKKYGFEVLKEVYHSLSILCVFFFWGGWWWESFRLRDCGSLLFSRVFHLRAVKPSNEVCDDFWRWFFGVKFFWQTLGGRANDPMIRLTN